MKCHICDATLNEINYSTDHDEFDPCPTCLAVVADTVGTFLDRPYLQDDELEGAFQAFFTAQADYLREETVDLA